MIVAILNDYRKLSPRVEDEKQALEAEGYKVKVLNWDRPIKTISWLLLPLHYIGLWRQLERMDSSTRLHVTHLLLLPIAILWARMRKAYVIYDSYEFYGEYRWYLRVLENWLVKRVDGVLTITSVGDIVANRYRRYCDNVEVVLNVPYLRDNSVAESENHTIAYVGKLSDHKGAGKMEEVLELLKPEYPDAKLLLIQNETYDDMLAALSKASIGLALQQPDPYFRLVTYGNGRKFFSYMQAGLPIVAPEFGEIGEVVRQVRCGMLCDTTDAQAVARAITFLWNDPMIAKIMGQRGRKAIEGYYNFNREKSKVLEVYRRTVE